MSATVVGIRKKNIEYLEVMGAKKYNHNLSKEDYNALQALNIEF